MTELTDDPGKHAVGLRTAVKILRKWDASDEQIQGILGISGDQVVSLSAPGSQVMLDAEQMKRISLILNIHSSLRVIFDNTDNLYEFMKMKNHNAGFDGRAPLEIIQDSDIQALVFVAAQVAGLSSAQW